MSAIAVPAKAARPMRFAADVFRFQPGAGFHRLMDAARSLVRGKVCPPRERFCLIRRDGGVLRFYAGPAVTEDRGIVDAWTDDAGRAFLVSTRGFADYLAVRVRRRMPDPAPVRVASVLAG